MLEKILSEVCQQMMDVLDDGQLQKLKNVLFIVFHNKVIKEEETSLIPAETDSDAELLKMFWASKKVSGRGNNTLKQYISELKSCRAAIGKNFTEISTMDIRWYLGVAKEKRKNKTTTIRNKIHYLNSFYSFLLNEEIITHNPMVKIETPKLEHVIRKPFAAEELEAIRGVCTHVRDRALVEFLYATGLRVSEVSSLNIGDIDLNQKEFTVIGKGNKERTVYISDTASYHLNEYIKWRQKKEGWKSLEDAKDNPLFVSTRKPYNRMKKEGIEHLCQRIGRKANVSNVHPHRFRRTFATDMASRGMKLEELMKLMGHSKMDTTLIYCNVGQENVKSSYRKCA